MKKVVQLSVWTVVCLMLCACALASTHAYAADASVPEGSLVTVAKPSVASKPYTGDKQVPTLADLDFGAFDAAAAGLDYTKLALTSEGGTDAGSYDVALTLLDTDRFAWEGTEEATVVVSFTIVQAANTWTAPISMKRWIAGNMPKDESVFSGTAQFGNPRFVVTAKDGTPLYDAKDGIDDLASARAGKYTLTVTVEETKNYKGLHESVTVEILSRGGLSPLDVWLVVGAVLLAVALVVFVLWHRGILRFWTQKKELQIRTQASVDATVAAVRAADRAREAKISLARAEAQDRAEERRRVQEVEYSLSEEARASLLEARAKATERRADRLQARAEAMRTRADIIRDPAVASGNPEAAQAQTTENSAEETTRVQAAEPLAEEAEQTQTTPLAEEAQAQTTTPPAEEAQAQTTTPPAEEAQAQTTTPPVEEDKTEE